MPPPAGLEEALERRVALDHAIRNGREMAGLPLADRYALQEGIQPTVRRVETENAAWLKTVLPKEGWFRLSRDGFDVAARAWEIVMHSRDPAWQKEILARMEPLFAQGEVDPQHYAHLYDRVMLAQTGKQRYGSHAVCRGDRMVIADMDEPEKVQERRDAIGFKTVKFSDVQAFYKDMPCDERQWRKTNSIGVR